MNIAPGSPTDQEVLNLAQREWLTTADQASYLPVGFGARHWRINGVSASVLFATLDIPSERRSLDDLELAYASAATLAAVGFAGIVAPIRSASGAYTVPLGGGVLSVTPWLDGRNPTLVESREPGHVAKVVALLTALHNSEAPSMLPVWRPQVSGDFRESLVERLQFPWDKAPLGEDARQKLTQAIDVVADSLREYHLLAQIALTSQDRWVPTHGEPHWANQFLVSDELVLVDWDTVALAPPEIDMIDLPWSARRELAANEDMLRMFRLEWQLTEIAEYADWFEAAHTGNDDDLAALAKLEKELRPI